MVIEYARTKLADTAGKNKGFLAASGAYAVAMTADILSTMHGLSIVGHAGEGNQDARTIIDTGFAGTGGQHGFGTWALTYGIQVASVMSIALISKLIASRIRKTDPDLTHTDRRFVAKLFDGIALAAPIIGTTLSTLAVLSWYGVPTPGILRML